RNGNRLCPTVLTVARRKDRKTKKSIKRHLKKGNCAVKPLPSVPPRLPPGRIRGRETGQKRPSQPSGGLGPFRPCGAVLRDSGRDNRGVGLFSPASPNPRCPERLTVTNALQSIRKMPARESRQLLKASASWIP